MVYEIDKLVLLNLLARNRGEEFREFLQRICLGESGGDQGDLDVVANLLSDYPDAQGSSQTQKYHS